MPARTLGGRYELAERLGAGGMAEVFRGQDRILGREVAVKILHERFARDPQYVARFRREARGAAALSHPNVVAVFDTGEDDGTRFIVMEYVRGRSLGDVIAEEAPLPPGRAVEIAAAVCDGLAAAHARGLVHRDIKPANIMLTGDGEAKVMDFGIARGGASETITGTATVMGTAPYLSPEQARGERVDARSDLYALGCVLYEMLGGTPPFTGENPVPVAARHVHEDPVPLEERNPDVPADLAAVVMRCLEKDPDRRYEDARALRAALLTGEAPATAAVPRLGGDTDVLPVPTALGRYRGGARFLALLGALALLGFVLAWALRAVNAPQDRAGEQGPAPGSEEPAAEERNGDRTPEEAFLALAAVVEEGLAAGEIDEEAARKITERGQEAVRKHADGKADDALEEVADLRQEVLDRTPEEIAPDRAGAILDAATALEESIRNHPAQDPDDGGGDGDEEGDDGDDDGNGRGRGGGPPGGSPPGRS